MKIGICVIAYNRVDSLQRVLKSLQEAYYPHKEDINLIISIDKSETTAVEQFADLYSWSHGTKRVIKHPENLGLRRHVLSCGDLLNEYDALIVLEDDIFVARNYYNYAMKCVEKYCDDNSIAGISLYNFYYNNFARLPFYPLHSDQDVYLMQNAQSWGQVWMKKQWFEFKSWYVKNNQEFGELPHLPTAICKWPKSSWLKYHTRYCIETGKFFVYPYESLSTCFADVGTHTSQQSTRQQTFLLYGEKKNYELNPTIMYDGFMECINIAKVLEIPLDSLCIDFYGTNENRLNKRYWLTRKKLPYKIERKYGLYLKPYEMNIIHDIQGDQLFLYDTSQRRSEKVNDIKYTVFEEYMYNVNFDLYLRLKSIVKKYLLKFIR